MAAETVDFRCPNCDTPLKAGANMAGTIGKCPQCQKEITVPEKSGETPQDAKSKN